METPRYGKTFRNLLTCFEYELQPLRVRGGVEDPALEECPHCPIEFNRLAATVHISHADIWKVVFWAFFLGTPHLAEHATTRGPNKDENSEQPRIAS